MLHAVAGTRAFHLYPYPLSHRYTTAQLIDAQLKHRMRSLETAEQEERKRKLMMEIEVLELETRKKVMTEQNKQQ